MKYRFVISHPSTDKPLQRIFPAQWTKASVLRVMDEELDGWPMGSIAMLYETEESLSEKKIKTGGSK